VCLTEEVFEVEVAAMRDCGRMRLKTDVLRSSLGWWWGTDEFEFLQQSFKAKTEQYIHHD